MKLLSVNASMPKEVPHRGGTVSTGIFKEPVGGRVMLRSLNLEGDGQADRNVHGGINKAVYAYPNEHYEYWSRELGRTDFTFGQFGENFTVSGMLEDAVRIGDVFRIGSALVEVTQPRAPCFKLGIVMGDQRFIKTFEKSGKTGFYFRVLREGIIHVGDEIRRPSQSPYQLRRFHPRAGSHDKQAMRLPGHPGSRLIAPAHAGREDARVDSADDRRG